MHVQRVRLRSEKFPTADRYPYSQPAVRNTPGLEFDSPICFFVGENGSGKTTLLEAVARRCGIHIWRDTERPRMEINPYVDSLHYYVEVTWTKGRVPGAFFSSSDFLHFSYTVDQWAAEDPEVLQFYGGRSLLVQSHGEAILAYLRARCQRPGLYLMDEPETALSPGNQLALARLLRSAAAAGRSQFIIATHSPILLACPDATIYSFDEQPVSRRKYADLPLVKMYRDFMADPLASMGPA